MNDPKNIAIESLFEQVKGPLLSYEFFPPKSDVGMANLSTAIEQLADSHPDFVTVTYGAGGSTRSRTLEVARRLQAQDFGPVMPHLTCVGSSRAELEEIAENFIGMVTGTS